ncbi:unnamed protein product [Callosobruchus maculatus]|uniref:Uncharacterized protein n=1 Tax=Callosobruchus maculatus TaxID=64391 RepID=A0A653D5F7_CALMS|nr:unnamed protein product [Callosobruchus maculatus]
MKLSLFAVLLATFQYVQCSPAADLTYTNIFIAYYHQCYKPRPFNSMALYLATLNPNPSWLQDDADGVALKEYVRNHYSEYGFDNGDPKCIQDFYLQYDKELSVNAFEDVLLDNPEVQPCWPAVEKLRRSSFMNVRLVNLLTS